MRFASGILNFYLCHLLVILSEGAEVRDLYDVLLLCILSQMRLLQDKTFATPRFSPVDFDRDRLPAIVLEDLKRVVTLV